MVVSPRATLTLSLACLASVLGAPRGARGAEPEARVDASMSCERAVEPGRIRCAVDARISKGAIAWGDVQLVDVPSFLTPLKGRISAADATTREPMAYRWALALVARQAGQGRVHGRVRLVVCEDAAHTRCVTSLSEVTAQVSVGR